MSFHLWSVRWNAVWKSFKRQGKQREAKGRPREPGTTKQFDRNFEATQNHDITTQTHPTAPETHLSQDPTNPQHLIRPSPTVLFDHCWIPSRDSGRSPTTAQAADTQPTSSDPNTQNKPITADQLAQKDAQLNEYKDLYIRARADFENLQKITTREKATAKEYAIQSFARDLVSNVDVLQLALNSVPESLRTTKEGEPENEGRKHLSTKSLLEKTLARYGVTPFDPTGQPFDPNKHEAMYQAMVPGKEPNSVLNCSKVGWMLRDRVLRPAQVGVAQGSD
ncbi:hypothetical protein H4Q26_000092 [Puccinia striiformis f. sp. tritici PST-130]|nr:hypothetical protein H4Q26_000092 [Puccinia striiformis f. sp. tritici PST-130]